MTTRLYVFWWRLRQSYACCERETAFVMQNFGIWKLVDEG